MMVTVSLVGAVVASSISRTQGRGRCNGEPVHAYDMLIVYGCIYGCPIPYTCLPVSQLSCNGGLSSAPYLQRETFFSHPRSYWCRFMNGAKEDSSVTIATVKVPGW